MRLDLYIAEKFSLRSRSMAANLIKKGAVTVNGKICLKTAFEVSSADSITLENENYASLGAYKLQKALDTFGIDVAGKKIADIGASNGGFTDCMLRRNAAVIYAVDVAECMLDEKLLSDGRVIYKRLNARNLTADDTDGPVDFITVDLSFISLKTVIPALKNLLAADGEMVCLIKPQFELGRMAGKSGIVKPEDRRKILNDLSAYFYNQGLTVKDICAVPRIFEDKNVEYTCRLSFRRGDEPPMVFDKEAFGKIK